MEEYSVSMCVNIEHGGLSTTVTPGSHLSGPMLSPIQTPPSTAVEVILRYQYFEMYTAINISSCKCHFFPMFDRQIYTVRFIFISEFSNHLRK